VWVWHLTLDRVERGWLRLCLAPAVERVTKFADRQKFLEAAHLMHIARFDYWNAGNMQFEFEIYKFQNIFAAEFSLKYSKKYKLQLQ
jgi:hypothetical protein